MKTEEQLPIAVNWINVVDCSSESISVDAGGQTSGLDVNFVMARARFVSVAPCSGFIGTCFVLVTRELNQRDSSVSRFLVLGEIADQVAGPLLRILECRLFFN